MSLPAAATVPAASSTPAPAAGATSGPAGTSAEPTQAAKAEPARAAEPAPASAEPAKAYPAPDTFGWDKWDGKPDLLPEEVRPWHEKFDLHFKTQSEAARLKAADDVAKAAAQAAQWRRMYEAGNYGQEDPRIGELTEKVGTYETAFTQYKEQQEQHFTEMKGEAEKATGDYFDYVVRQNADFFKGLTPPMKELLAEATEHIPLHAAVDYAKYGEGVLKEALALAQKGADVDVIDRIIKAERTSAAADRPPKQPSASVDLVTGGNPAQPPPRVPESRGAARGGESPIARAARIAIEAENAGRARRRT